jgi:hypothetical protein
MADGTSANRVWFITGTSSGLDAEEPPLRLVLGADAIGNIREQLERVGDELTRCEEVGRNTAIDPDGRPIAEEV